MNEWDRDFFLESTLNWAHSKELYRAERKTRFRDTRSAIPFNKNVRERGLPGVAECVVDSNPVEKLFPRCLGLNMLRLFQGLGH
jgi:hypothetical protein